MSKLMPPSEPLVTEDQFRDVAENVLKRAHDWICDSLETIPKERWSHNTALTYMRILAVLAYLGKKPAPRIENWEIAFIKDLHKMKCSIRDIAYVIPRSTSTIHKYTEA